MAMVLQAKSRGTSHINEQHGRLYEFYGLIFVIKIRERNGLVIAGASKLRAAANISAIP